MVGDRQGEPGVLYFDSMPDEMSVRLADAHDGGVAEPDEDWTLLILFEVA